MSSIVQEMVTSLRNSKAQLTYVEQQLQALKQQEHVLKETIDEVGTLKSGESEETTTENTVWRSCGRAFIKQDKSVYLNDLQKNSDTLSEHMKALSIKKEYLTTSIEKTVENMKKHMK